MARPRVFVSSTFYDLRHIRNDLERFIRDMGFEPVLNERGHVPYGSEMPLEEYCYSEIGLVDMLVSVVGGRYGTASQRGKDHSISQQELQTAVKLGKHVFVFIEKGVHAEYQTYLENKELEGIRFKHVDNRLVYQFIEELELLPANKTIHPFDSAHDITSYLKEQWAGLLQRFLSQNSQKQQLDAANAIQNAVATLNDLVKYVSEQNKGDAHPVTVRDILLFNHPLFDQMRRLHAVGYPVVIFSRPELEARLKAWGFVPREFDFLDDSAFTYFVRSVRGKQREQVAVADALFDDQEKLKILAPGDWDENMYRLEPYAEIAKADDIPF